MKLLYIDLFCGAGGTSTGVENARYMGEQCAKVIACVNHDAPYSEHMGRDIAALLECDAVMFMPGWTRSRGCRLEYQAAKIYDKQRIFFKNILW